MPNVRSVELRGIIIPRRVPMFLARIVSMGIFAVFYGIFIEIFWGFQKMYYLCSPEMSTNELRKRFLTKNYHNIKQIKLKKLK